MSPRGITTAVLSLLAAAAIGWGILSQCPEPAELPADVVSAMKAWSSGGHASGSSSALREVLENFDHIQWRENCLKWFTSLDSAERLMICGLAFASQSESFWDFEFPEFSHLYSSAEAADRRREIEIAKRNTRWFRWHIDRTRLKSLSRQ